MWFTHRKDVLHGDDKHVVCDEEIPVTQNDFNWLKQQLSTKEQEVKTSDQVAHTENADACGPRNEDDGEDEPEQIAEHDHLQHIKIGSKRNRRTAHKS